MNIAALQGLMRERNMSVDDLAEKAGIDRSALYRRLKSGGEKFTVAEARKISAAMSMDDDMTLAVFLRQ